jgi:hypothetical protein
MVRSGIFLDGRRTNENTDIKDMIGWVFRAMFQTR